MNSPNRSPDLQKPPRGALMLLGWFCDIDLFDEIAGDLEEQYQRNRRSRSKPAADIHCWMATLLFFRPAFLRSRLFNPSFQSTAMWTNNFKVAGRHLRRHFAFSTVNILGLTVGMTCCLLALLYVSNELAYDQFHQNKDRIYRLGTDITSNTGSTGYNSTVDWPVGRIVRERYPAIESLVYMRRAPSKIILDGAFYFRDIFYAEDSFTDIFDFPMTDGNADTALEKPYSAVVSTSTARDLFGTQDVLGRTLIMEDSLAYEITGVMDVPRRSHIQFDVLLSFSTFAARTPEFYNDEHWLDLNMINYVMLQEGASQASVDASLSTLIDEEVGDLLKEYGYEGKLVLEPLTDIYLRSNRGNLLGPTGNMTYVRLLEVIGLFILGIACVNFVNLTTARSMERAREVGVRKYVGATRASLVQQFLSEALLISLGSILLALLVTAALIPGFNILADTALPVASVATPTVLLGAFGLWLTVGLLAGSYPSFVLARFRATSVLRGSFSRGRAGVALRRGLVVFQFAVSIILIVGTLVVQRQIRHMMNADVGFDREQVAAIQVSHVEPDVLQRSNDVLQESLGKLAGVRSVTATNAVPGRNGWRSKIVWPEGMDRSEGLITEVVTVDPEFVQTMGLDIIAGRDFDPDITTDPSDAVLVNETAAREMGWGTPEYALGKFIDSPSHTIQHTVVGVVRDYHHHSLKERIKSIVYVIQPSYEYIAVRAETDGLAGLTPRFESVWKSIFPDYAYSGFFLDDDFNQQYQSELRVKQIFSIFTLIAVMISCLGLFSLAAYSTVRRTREIGIRRVMGASVPRIVGLLTREFMALVAIALVIGIPVALILSGNWLQDYPDPVSPGIGLVTLTVLASFAIAFVTVGVQALRAASTRPVESLRSE